MLFEQVNPGACQTYLLASEDTGEALLVDPVLERVTEYLRLVAEKGLRLTHVIDTHTHADHISGAAALKDMAACEYAMAKSAPARCVTKRLSDGLDLEVGSIALSVINTPGHTSDSVSLVLSDRVLTGDALFLDDAGAGRDDLPGGDPGAHWESLQRILALPDHLVVYPAHEYRGRQPSALRRQKQTNPHLSARTKEAFVRYVEDLRLGPADWMKDVLKANYACARDPRAAWIPADLPACEVQGTAPHGANDVPVEASAWPSCGRRSRPATHRSCWTCGNSKSLPAS